MKKIATVIALLVFGFTAAFAAGLTAKVTAVDGDIITLEMKEKAAWVKKGANVRFSGQAGKITAVEDGTVKIKSGKTSLKAGDEVSIEKGRAAASEGC